MGIVYILLSTDHLAAQTIETSVRTLVSISNAQRCCMLEEEKVQLLAYPRCDTSHCGDGSIKIEFVIVMSS